MKKLLLLTLCFALTACGARGLGGSFVGELPDNNCRDAIAEDAANFISNEHAPGHTKIFILTPEEKAKNDFGNAFEQNLRERGFTLLQESEKDALTIAYTIDGLKSENGKGFDAYYLQLRTSEGVAFARSYDADGKPEAGRSSTPLKNGFFKAAAKKASEKVSATYDAAKIKVEELVNE